MPNASKTELDEIDQTFSPAAVPVGISALLGWFKRGPINDPSVIVSGWPQFVKLFGGFISGLDDPIIAKRAIERGSQLRVINLRHYTDPTNAASLTAVVATPTDGKTIALNGALIAVNLITVVINAISVSQVFAISSDNTFNLLVAKIKQTASLQGIISKVAYLGANKMIITPATGVVLVVTCTVTLGATQAAPTVAIVNTIANSTGTELFQLVPKNAGGDYNNLQYDILPASNGSTNSFDLLIEHLIEPGLNERYRNITIPGIPTNTDSTYLQAIVNGSQIVDVVYKDLSALAAPVRPVNTFIKLDDGSDGGALVDNDIIGSSVSKTGVYALDPYNDALQFGCANSNSVGVIAGLSAYADNRKDIDFFAHIDNSFVTEAQVAAFRDSTFVDSSYTAFFAGGLTIVDPSISGTTAVNRQISEIGDVLGAAAYSAAKFGPWYSFAGKRRGIITNCLGIVNNFGLASNYNNRNFLANHQVNIVGSNKGLNKISGNFTAQLGQSELSFLNVRRNLLYMKDLLGPIFDSYIEEPNDPVSWLALYQEVKPQLEILKTKRAILDYKYQGDQFIKDVTKVVINNTNDIDQGKYVVNLYIKDTVSLQWIQVNIILTDSGVSFEDSASSVGDSSTN